MDGRGEGERVGDAADYHAYAESLLSTGRYENLEGERASRMPGYPVLLAAQYATLGRAPLVTQLVQCVLGALTCVLVVLLASRWSDPPWPLAAGLLAAFSLDLVAPCARLLTEATATLAVTAALWFVSQDKALTRRRAALAGLAAGAGFLLRPEVGPWTILLAAHAGWRSRWRNALILLTASAALVLPWAARNAAVLGRPVITTTAGPFNLYGWGVPRTIEERLGGPRWERAPEGSTEVARMDFYAERARHFFLMEGRAPAIAKAVALNLLLLFHPFSALPPTFLMLAPLAVLGLWVSRKDPWRRPLLWTLAYFSCVYAFAGVMIPRHRDILGAVLVLLAAEGLRRLHERLGAAAFARAAAAWGAAGLAVWAAEPALRAALRAARDRALS